MQALLIVGVAQFECRRLAKTANVLADFTFSALEIRLQCGAKSSSNISVRSHHLLS
jgi:hypothetical protein